MIRSAALFLVLLFAGWGWEGIVFYVLPSACPSPQWLLLAAVAMGSRGRTDRAMTLGFLWGLGLDAFGDSAFGVQGWLLAAAATGAGLASKNLNTEKWATQWTLALVSTLFVDMGSWVLSDFFSSTRIGTPTVGRAAWHLALNGLAAPAVFWAVSRWDMLEKGRGP